jgi:FMN-binding domain
VRRVVPALVATVGGLALLANFHTSSGSKPRVLAAPSTSTTPTAGGPPPTGSGAEPTTTTLGGGSRQIDGAAVPMQYGTVQVRVILTNGKITDVQPIQLPFDRRRSQEISQGAAPLLHDEVLQAQSAHINLVSGATFTSDAYAQSLQAALSQIGK